MILSLRNPGRGPHFHTPRSRGRENRKGGELHRGSALVKVLQRTKTRGHVHVHRGGGGGGGRGRRDRETERAQTGIYLKDLAHTMAGAGKIQNLQGRLEARKELML